MRRRVSKAPIASADELDRLLGFCPYCWLPEGTVLGEGDDDPLEHEAFRAWVDACKAYEALHGPLPSRPGDPGARWWGLTMDQLTWHANGHPATRAEPIHENAVQPVKS